MHWREHDDSIRVPSQGIQQEPESPLQKPGRTWIGASYPWLTLGLEGDEDEVAVEVKDVLQREIRRARWLVPAAVVALLLLCRCVVMLVQM